MRLKSKNSKFPINKKRIIENKKMGRNAIGWVYILSNTCYHLSDGTPVYKIGHTLRTPQIRAWELYEGIKDASKKFKVSGVPIKFQVAAAYQVPSGYAEKIEKGAHKKLNSFRVYEYREFFACDISICKKAIEEAKAELTIKKKRKRLFKLI